ncbi:MAG: DUF4405 domain-containing protein [Pseudomonadota bacterium]|nr:DUF4405 domain-containing protein [Pseudomonadota bacterium]
MVKNKQSTRSLVAFLVTWSFIVLTVTGIVLYIVPQGRIAYWVHWSLMGLEKEQWGWVHMMFGGIFILTGGLHLYFNWKPFKKYLAERAKGQIRVKQELVVSLALTALVFALSVLDLPPASWVFALNEQIKNAWVTSPELEPPFGHAEEVSLAGIARRMNLDLASAVAALEAEGIRFDSERDSLEKIARVNGITPMTVFGIVRRFENEPEPVPVAGLTPEEVEVRYSGSGLGRKSLKELCRTIGLDQALALRRLAAAGIQAQPEDKARELAERHGISPIDLLKVMMIPDFRPSG